MQRYTGFWENGHTYEIRVPGTLSDQQIATIDKYQGRCGRRRGDKINTVTVPLRSRPHWDVSCQATLLSREDERKVQSAVDALIQNTAFSG